MKACCATRENPDDLEAHGSPLPTGLLDVRLRIAGRVPMGASHAIGHVLGGTCDVPHYFCTAVMMPSVLRYNRPATEAAQKVGRGCARRTGIATPARPSHPSSPGTRPAAESRRCWRRRGPLRADRQRTQCCRSSPGRTRSRSARPTMSSKSSSSPPDWAGSSFLVRRWISFGGRRRQRGRGDPRDA